MSSRSQACAASEGEVCPQSSGPEFSTRKGVQEGDTFARESSPPSEQKKRAMSSKKEPELASRRAERKREFLKEPEISAKSLGERSISGHVCEPSQRRGLAAKVCGEEIRKKKKKKKTKLVEKRVTLPKHYGGRKYRRFGGKEARSPWVRAGQECPKEIEPSLEKNQLSSIPFGGEEGARCEGEGLIRSSD